MRRAKKEAYTDENVKTLCDFLAKGASVAEACTATGISTASYHGWRKNNPEFYALTERAIERYQENIKESFDNLLDKRRTAAEKWIDDVLFGRIKITKTKTKRDGEGSIIEILTEEESFPPKWLLERFLPKEEEDNTVNVVVNFSDDEPPETPEQ